MSLASQKERPTDVLIEVGEILRTLNPSLLGALKVASQDETLTQSEIADIIGRSNPTVSTYFQSLQSFSLTAKRSQRNIVTDTGAKVVGLIESMFSQLGRSLDTIDWKDEADVEYISEKLSPLHDSRSMGPFFLLDSLYERSDIHGHVGTRQPVWVDEAISDVKLREEDRGESTSTRLVRETIRRFDDTGVISFDGTKLELTDKGHQQAWLVNELAQYLKTEEEETGNNVRGHTETAMEGLNDYITGQSSSSNESRSPLALDDATQIMAQSDSGVREPFAAEQLVDQEKPIVIAGYCLRSVDENRENQDRLPMLPITEMTVEDLINQATQLRDAFDEEAKLVPYWFLQTESELYPLAPYGTLSSD
jgi:predicted transcriptional regulator